MSPSVKLGLLTLVSGAAAIPHYARHNSFHHKPSGGYYGPGTGTGGPFPTGHHNGTGYGHPSGTGVSVSPEGEKTTTLLDTLTSTTTVVKTVYATRPTSLSAGAEDVSSGAPACGPATVYVTATNKVTVTVQPSSSSSSSSSSAAAVASSSSSAAVYVPVPSSSVVPVSSAEAVSSAAASSASSAYAPASSSVVYELPSSSAVEETKPSLTVSFPNKPVEATSSAAAYTSAAVEATSAAASSAAATPSSSPSYSGGKRGLAYNDESLCSSFASGKFSFSYNWGQTGGDCAGAGFAPMMHKPSDSTAEAWLANVDKAYKAGSRVVMGFNEPDHSAQANLSPEQACSDWTTYMEPIASKYSDITILGPSVTNGPAPMGLDWLSRFKTACPSATWHATNVHFYDIPDGDACATTVERFQSHVEQAASDFGKPVWVTEFGLNLGSASSQQAADFLKGTMDYMEGSDKVQGYAYFMVGTDASMNELLSGSALSSTGEVYNS
ncbi:glycosyl hydrolase catalytic core-domain-containing protein [Lophiotrema nucula]|uniref:Glycosyl hydrolase catalytic core-domain-containing protein n=1 Tax=Lophiotrema nucula TaxID=690887 RepID=A0A6A5YMJ5_9PLEO|nr:glycosyl hydrolase catalytic core-domain-containing protein [Lophiotrema nucula]